MKLSFLPVFQQCREIIMCQHVCGPQPTIYIQYQPILHKIGSGKVEKRFNNVLVHIRHDTDVQ